MGWEQHEGQWVRRTAVVADPEAFRAAVYTLGVNETARRAKCSNPMVSRLASGDLKGCTVAMATKIATALGADLDTLFLIKIVSQTARHVQTGQTSERKSA